MARLTTALHRGALAISNVRARARAKRVVLLRIAGACVAALAAFGAWVRLGPLPDGLLDLDAALSTVVVDRYGEALYEARSTGGRRTPIRASSAAGAGSTGSLR